MEKTKRVTKKFLTKWIDEKMIALEIPFHVSEITHTRLRSYEYEGGAAFFVVCMARNEADNEMATPLYFYIFYSLMQIQHYLNSGYALQFKPHTIYSLNDAEIGLRKI